MVLKILEFEKMKTLRNFILEGEFYVLNVHIYMHICCIKLCMEKSVEYMP